jgi:prepilin signal peptidase PulO-like enzyme (type II secretory pathway)
MSPAPGSLQPLFVILAALVGLFVGSFLNVVVYRTPRKLSVVEPRSFCPGCERTLTWWENVPLISWVALGGRCRTCGMAISVRYPALELLTGVAFALVTWAWRASVTSVAFCALAAGAVAVTAIELDRLRAPLAVEGVATGIALPVVVVANAVPGHAWVVLGALIGTAAGWTGLVVVRRIDPECRDRRQHGRSLLLGTGCWLGAVAGVRAWTVGLAAAVAVVVFGLLVAVGERRRIQPSERSPAPVATTATTWHQTPLVAALLAAMVASLIAMG